MRSEYVSFEDGIQGFTRAAVCPLPAPPRTRRFPSTEPLSVMELALLRYFRAHTGRTLSREELAAQVWKQQYFYRSRTIDQTVSNLRKKLEPQDGRIRSVRSDGYRLESDLAESQLQEGKRERSRNEVRIRTVSSNSSKPADFTR